MRSTPEILAPAGDLPAIHAALAAGADAIYFGLDDGFNARARAANFDSNNLREVVELIHRGGARAYVTMNTLVFEPELPVVELLLRRIAAAGVDAIIVQDPAVCVLARALCPELELHASTQMTLSSPAAAELLRPLGLTRVVVPRELSVDEISLYAAGTTLPLEVFIHGALCVSWSGQCLTSESWGGRSANRGQCAQSCRLPYDLVVDGQRRDLGDVKYLLSPQDLVGLTAVERLAEIGVASLKIEGRLKGPHYVATTVASYKKQAAGLDEAALRDDLATMEYAYSRGSSPGFLGGADHQRLVEGRFPRHRGVPLGVVEQVRGEYVFVRTDAVMMRPWTGALATELRPDGATGDRSAEIPELPRQAAEPRAGMGVVFDSGTADQNEQGGPIFAVDAWGEGASGGFRLKFGMPGPDLNRVTVGDRVWISSDPQVLKLGSDAAARGALPVGRIAVNLRVVGVAGEPLHVEAWAKAPGGRALHAQASSSMPLAAATGAGLGEATLRDKLGGFGGTAFHLGDLNASAMATGLHIPVGALKEVRRLIAASLDEQLVAVDRVIDAGPVAARVVGNRQHTQVAHVSEPRIVPMCRTDAQLDAILAAGIAEEVELDWMEFVGLGRAVERARASGVRVVVATVRVQKPGEEKLDAHLARLRPDGVLVRSWGALAYFASLPKDERPLLHGDFSLNVTNSITAGWVLERGLATATCAHDLDSIQLAALLETAPRGSMAVTVHHHIPTFHTEHCVYAHQLSAGRDYKSCGRPCEKHEIALGDRVGMVHPVVVDVGCRNTVFNAQAQSAASLVPSLLAAGVTRFRVELVRESAAEAVAVVKAYRELIAGAASADEVLRRVRVSEQFGVTKGTMRTLTVIA